MSNLARTSSSSFFFNRKKKYTDIKIGDIGIHHDVLTHYNLSNFGDGSKINVFSKVKVLEVFENLVEIEVISIDISANVNSCVVELAKNNICKYIDPKNIKWSINSNNQ